MKSPTTRLVAGVIVTLLIVGAHAGYTLYAVNRMRRVQSETIDRNRKASLQLIRIQSDLNALALAMRDMLDNLDGYPLTAWSGQLDRIRENLDDAIRVESGLSRGRRSAQQTAYLASSFAQFWTAVSQMMEAARSEQPEKARLAIRNTLQPRQEALSALVARLLVANNDAEQLAAGEVNLIYSGIERNAYLFLMVSLALVAVVSVSLIRSNRILFDRLNELSNQRRELARQLISTQESTLRAISRDLHDEFGQILTALGTMLTRAARLAPGTEFHEQLQETKEVVQETLEKIRGLSQSLQPVILEEQGLAAAIQWYLATFERQTGIAIHCERPETLPHLESSLSIHVFRILQEALNNIAKHANVKEARVRIQVRPNEMSLEIEDHGQGMPDSRKPGVGLTGMRERAELLGGTLSISRRPGSGTVIRLLVPVEPRAGNV